MRTSVQYEACNKCKHQENIMNQWCYMFIDKPEVLPCGQHDKFAVERAITGHLIKKYPSLMFGFLSGHLIKE